MKTSLSVLFISCLGLLAGGLAGQSPFPARELGVSSDWKDDLERRFDEAFKPWMPERGKDTMGRPFVVPGKNTVLPYSKTVRSPEVVVAFDAGDTFVLTTRLGDSKSDTKKMIRELDPADALPLMFEIMGRDDAVSGLAVARKLANSGATATARAALAWTMRVNLHQRELISRAACAVLNEPEPEGGFYAQPEPATLVDAK